MGILLGLVAALAWGVGDFFAARLSRLVGTRRAPLYTQSLGVAVSTLLVVLWGARFPAVAPRIWLAMLALGVTHAAATRLFYRALEIGKISLTMPITSSFAVVTAVLAFCSGERPARLAIAGAVIALLGLVCVTVFHRGEELEGELGEQLSTQSVHSARGGDKRGVWEATGAALCFGATFWGLDFLEPHLGAAWMLLVMRAVTLPILSTLFLLSRRANQCPVTVEAQGVLWLCAVAVITCDTVAWLAVGFGRRTEDVSIVTTLASLYSAVTVVLAWLLWHERLQRSQWLGVALILAGVALVGIG